jgi:hypothetical protein
MANMDSSQPTYGSQAMQIHEVSSTKKNREVEKKITRLQGSIQELLKQSSSCD